MGDTNGQMDQFELCLEPVIQFMAGLAAAFQIDLESAGPNLFLRWTVNHHLRHRHHAPI